MNAPVPAIASSAPIDLREVLRLKAEIRAFLWWHYIIGPYREGADELRCYAEGLHEAVDELQRYANDSGLVAAFGQEFCQTIIAGPFARLRAMAHQDEPAEIGTDEEPVSEPDDFTEFDRAEIARRIERWEANDAQRSGPREAMAPRQYRPAVSTIQAFWFVVRTKDADGITQWLAEHPLDAPHLHELWKTKCSTAPAI